MGYAQMVHQGSDIGALCFKFLYTVDLTKRLSNRPGISELRVTCCISTQIRLRVPFLFFLSFSILGGSKIPKHVIVPYWEVKMRFWFGKTCLTRSEV